MTNTAPLLRCAHCGSSSLYDLDRVERDRGDWILRCPVCDADNVITLHLESTHPIEIAGWRDR